jgi:peptidoglycan hydrolase CwlO-like protein
MENENVTTKIDTEAELKAQVEELKEELKQAKEKNEDQRRVIDGLNNELERRNGMIDGLKFAIRCNGVSGAEV